MSHESIYSCLNGFLHPLYIIGLCWIVRCKKINLFRFYQFSKPLIREFRSFISSYVFRISFWRMLFIACNTDFAVLLFNRSTCTFLDKMSMLKSNYWMPSFFSDKLIIDSKSISHCSLMNISFKANQLMYCIGILFTQSVRNIRVCIQTGIFLSIYLTHFSWSSICCRMFQIKIKLF